MLRRVHLILCLALILTGCAREPSPQPTFTPTIAVTEQPQAEATGTDAPVEVTATLIVPTRTAEPLFQVPSFSCPGAVAIRVSPGSIARITYTTGEGLRIRNAPRLDDSNIVDLVAEGDYIDILDGPECVTGGPGVPPRVFWKVRDREAGVEGWAAEGEPGNYYIEYYAPPRQLRGDAELSAAFEAALGIMMSYDLSLAEKRAELRLVQRDYDEEVLVAVLEYVPVYDSDLHWFQDFDTYIRHFISGYGSWSSDSPFEEDPIRTGLAIFFDPSPENISALLGLD